ncbi:hypothetical protein pb186bvf_003021 [Paramecium bursaria]
MSLSQAGRQAINPITGESRFQQPVDYRRTQEQPEMKISSESKRDIDRISQVQDQVQYLEKQLMAEIKRNQKILQDMGRDALNRSDVNMDDIENRLDQKIHSIQTQQDRVRQEMFTKMAMQEQNVKEVMYMIKNFQNKDTNEILQMRGMLQDKITEENNNLQKEREKTKALFMEVVRLGEQSERLHESLQSMNHQHEQKLLQLESKIYNGEKALVQVAQKGDAGINYLNETNERFDKRLLQLETNLIAMQKDQLKDHDLIGRTDNSLQRLQEDLKAMLITIQQDYQGRLESRMTEVVNRIVMEHEARVKSVDELKQNIQIKDQMNAERYQYEREELTSKILGLEQMWRTDSQKKDEQFRQIQVALETQVNAIFINLQNEEAQRYAHEVALRADLLKIQENIKQENEMFKSHQTNVIEKITEMIRVEVQNRLSSDVDLKNLTSAIASDIVADLNQLKDQIDQQQRSYQLQLQQIDRDSSERSERLSLYVDEEVQKISKYSQQKQDKLKMMLQKLGEQFKQFLLKFESSRQDTESRIINIEQNVDVLRNETQQFLEQLNEHLLNRIAEEKNIILQTAAQSFQIIEDKLNKLDQEQLQKFQILKEGVEENHQLIADKIKLILEKSDNFQKEIRQAMQSIGQGVMDLKDTLYQVQKELQEQIRETIEKIKDTSDRLEQTIQQLNDALQSIEQINNQLKDHKDSIEILEKDNDENKIKVQDIIKQIQQIEDKGKVTKEYIDKLTTTIDTVGSSVAKMHDQSEKQLHKFNELQQQMESLLNDQQKLEQEDQRINQRITDEMKQQLLAHNNLKDETKAIQDKVRHHDDNNTKLTLEVKDLSQSVNHLQEQVKKLAPLQ